jgi:ribosomal-protein-alanine N-acetyltransferase
VKLPGTWEIRPIAAADAPALAALHGDGAEGAWSAETFAGLLLLPGTFGFIAAARGVPQGFVLARAAADEAEILTIAVARGSRRRGLGGRLMQMAAGEAAGRGAARLFLEVAEDNEAALALYRALGFAEAGRRPSYYGKAGQPRRDALLMALRLDAPPRATG